jgi:hypothetical protein
MLTLAFPAAATAPTVNGIALTSDGMGGVGVPICSGTVVGDELSLEHDNKVHIDNNTREIARPVFILNSFEA